MIQFSFCLRFFLFFLSVNLGPQAEPQAEEQELQPEPDSSKSAYEFFVASIMHKMSNNISEEKVCDEMFFVK